jgi:hypothetical protein
MGSILKEEHAAQAGEASAVKVAGSVGRYSNVEYWQQKSETFKQQVCAQHLLRCYQPFKRFLQHNNVILNTERPTRRALMPASRNPITWE